MPSSHDNPGPLPAEGQFVHGWRWPVARWMPHPDYLTSPWRSSRRARLADEARDKSRRVLNVVVAGLSLVLLSPLFLLIALSVRLSSPGPVFFTQERVGLDQRRLSKDRRARSRAGLDRRGSDAGGTLFTMYKFRTMYVNDGPEQQVWAQKNDPRITPVGRVLRAFRLDEFPQLWNVLLGHMNIVGPRPEQPEIFQDLRSELADYQRRQHVLPGITGWAQINNGYDQSFRDVECKVEYDLEYLERRSLVEDVKIMLKTVPVVLGRKGFH